MNTMRSSIENTFKGNHVYIIMNGKCPNTGCYSMEQDNIDVYWNEVATGEYRNSLNESI